MKHFIKTVSILCCTALMFAFTACNDITVSGDEPNGDPPKETISVEEADVLEEEFKNFRAIVLNEALGKVDRRDFWFSLKTMKAYIAYVEKEAKEMNFENNDLGLRVYFAAYPQQGDYPDPGYATVFMAPTVRDVKASSTSGFVPFTLNTVDNDTIRALNFGHAGKPPNEYNGD
ncbi:MAG: hypothetical protein ACPG7E_05070 [Marinirhabdus sp.]